MSKGTVVTICVICGLLLEGYREHRADTAGEPPRASAVANGVATASSEAARTRGEFARSSAMPPIATAPSWAQVRIDLETPIGAKAGDPVDVVISIDALRPVRRIALEVAYDPALLRPRSLEEIEYGSAAFAQGRFVVEERDAGRISAVAASFGSKALATGSSRLAVAQFQATSPGISRIDISHIEIDDGQAPLRYSLNAASREVAIR
jgi:hypothetical protein